MTRRARPVVSLLDAGTDSAAVIDSGATAALRPGN